MLLLALVEYWTSTPYLKPRKLPRSLAVLDELGRGTSTFDGTAIALAVLRHVALEIRARCPSLSS